MTSTYPISYKPSVFNFLSLFTIDEEGLFNQHVYYSVLITGPGLHTANYVDKIVIMRRIRISPAADDWFTKGAHVHIGSHELSIKPADGGRLIITPTFGSMKERDFHNTSILVAKALSLVEFRNKLIHLIEGLKNKSGTSPRKQHVAKGAEFHFLEKALLKY